MELEWEPFIFTSDSGWYIECVKCRSCGGQFPDTPAHKLRHQQWHEEQGW